MKKLEIKDKKYLRSYEFMEKGFLEFEGGCYNHIPLIGYGYFEDTSTIVVFSKHTIYRGVKIKYSYYVEISDEDLSINLMKEDLQGNRRFTSYLETLASMKNGNLLTTQIENVVDLYKTLDLSEELKEEIYNEWVEKEVNDQSEKTMKEVIRKKISEHFEEILASSHEKSIIEDNEIDKLLSTSLLDNLNKDGFYDQLAEGLYENFIKSEEESETPPKGAIIQYENSWKLDNEEEPQNSLYQLLQILNRVHGKEGYWFD